jgi:hypothetical protein
MSVPSYLRYYTFNEDFKAVPGTGTVVWIRIRIDFGRPDPDPGGQK